MTVIHPTITEAMNDIKEKEKEGETEQNGDKIKGKQVPSRVAHRQVNVHGVSQGGAPNVYNLDHEGYLLGLASRTHSKAIILLFISSD